MNKWTGIGRLTKNPEVRYTSRQDGTQTCIARYTLAVDRRYNKNGEQGADFINCVAFGKAGEFAEKYLKQGIKIGVCGRIQTGSYTTKEGQKVYTTDIIVEEQEFVEPKKAEQPESNGFINIPEDVENTLPWK